jgi:hypothetical protein
MARQRRASLSSNNSEFAGANALVCFPNNGPNQLSPGGRLSLQLATSRRDPPLARTGRREAAEEGGVAEAPIPGGAHSPWACRNHSGPLSGTSIGTVGFEQSESCFLGSLPVPFVATDSPLGAFVLKYTPPCSSNRRRIAVGVTIR